MIDYQYAGWVFLGLFIISLFIGSFLCRRCLDDMFFVIGLISGIIAIVGAFFLAPDKRTPTERFNDKLSEYNMSVDNMVYIDEGKVFKFDNEYYLRTSNGDIVSLSTRDASIAYEK
jgi:hypothetical protein